MSNEPEKKKHGGSRSGSGRKRKDPPEKRITFPVILSPANAKYLRALGRGKNDYLNLLLDRERNEQENGKDD